MNRVLSFEKGEELEVVNPVPGADWWEVSGRGLCHVTCGQTTSSLRLYLSRRATKERSLPII